MIQNPLPQYCRNTVAHNCRTRAENSWISSTFCTWHCRIRTAILPHSDLQKRSGPGRKPTEPRDKPTELMVKSTELPTELRDRIADAGRKADKAALLQFAVDFLAERPLSAGDLALVLGRTQKHVRTEYLQPLLDESRVVRSNPNKPTDPNQTYRVPEDSENRR